MLISLGAIQAFQRGPIMPQTPRCVLKNPHDSGALRALSRPLVLSRTWRCCATTVALHLACWRMILSLTALSL